LGNVSVRRYEGAPPGTVGTGLGWGLDTGEAERERGAARPVRLNGLDAALVELETDRTPLQMIAVLMLDTTTVPGGYEYARLRDFLATRIHVVPPCRRMLVAVPGKLHRPVWAEVGELDWDYHLPRVVSGEPLDLARLSTIAAELAEQRLDRSRPLWQLLVVEDATAPRVAVIARVHHALMDGLGGMEFMGALFSLEPTPPTDNAPVQHAPANPPSSVGLLVNAAGALAEIPGTALRLGRNLARIGQHAVMRRRSSQPRAARLFDGPPTPFNARLTVNRTVSLTQLPFPAIRTLARETGATINEIVLTLVSGALRTYLVERGALPARPLVAAVPAGAADAASAARNFGNAFSVLLIRLPTGEPDARRRLAEVREESERAKDASDDLGVDTLGRFLDLMTPLPVDAALFLYRALLVDRLAPIWNVMVSNVPGPPVPLFVAGARLVGLYPIGPIYDGLALNVTVLSREDSLDIGILGCRDHIPAVSDLAVELHRELEGLAALVGVDLEPAANP
jgi:diacylglycerol O-acyltransferase / wax synthase